MHSSFRPPTAAELAPTRLMSHPTASISMTPSALVHVPAARLPHLDGLRTLALLGVLLFHFKIPLFSGGFVGVDIFFTLSGYLITRNILHSLRHHQFDLVSFYTRRFFRLFPASCFTILFTLVVTYLFIAPTSAESIFNSAFAALTLWSNIYFHREGSYFDATFEMRPLLHFWSLSVEEQFYILWPPILLTTWAFCSAPLVKRSLSLSFSKVTFYTLSAFALASFVFATWMHVSRPSWTFYELPSRVFQFAGGALLAIRLLDSEIAEEEASKQGERRLLLNDQQPIIIEAKNIVEPSPTDQVMDYKSVSVEMKRKSSYQDVKFQSDPDDGSDDFDTQNNDNINDVHDGVSIAAFLTIVLSFSLMPENPAPIRVLPVMIATLALIAYPDAIICQLVFRKERVAQIGRASYAIYLIHWPLIVAIGYFFQGILLPSILHVPILLPLSIILGFYIFQYVETPLRMRRSWSNVLIVLFMGIVTISFAMYGSLTHGIKSRFPEQGQTGWRSDPESIHGKYWTYVRDISDQWPYRHPNVHVRHIGDLSGKRSKYVFFGDSFTDHLTAALYNVGLRHKVYFETHYSFHCGFRATSSLTIWNGGFNGFRCEETSPLLWKHIDLVPNSSTIVVANWWCAPTTLVWQLDELHKELVAHGKRMAVFSEPPGVNEMYKYYYPCADLRVLPLGRFTAWALRRHFVGGRHCLPFDKGLAPEWQIGAERKEYRRAFGTFLNQSQWFDIFRHMCRKQSDGDGDSFLCSVPANLSSVVYDIGYKKDLAHMSSVGSDYVTEFVDAELFGEAQGRRPARSVPGSE